MTASATPAAGALSRRAFLCFDIVPARTTDDWVRVHRPAMACRFEVVLPSRDAHHVADARAALDEADRIEALLTIFRDSSEVSRVNQAASAGPVEVSDELFGLVRRSIDLHRQTDGAFDITVSPLSRCWGFLEREGRMAAAAEIEEARASVSSTRLELDPARRTIRFLASGMALNFGAMGKGYALDRMAAILRDRGVTSALLSAGGSSVLALGGGRGWPIDVRSPRIARGPLASLRLRNAALGTSGAGEQFFTAAGERFGHVLDPRTGRPAANVLSASVVTRDAETADALSTAMFVGGPSLAGPYCAANQDVLALVTPDDGTERPLVFGRADGASLEDVARCT